jgi:hypothetical protein
VAYNWLETIRNGIGEKTWSPQSQWKSMMEGLCSENETIKQSYCADLKTFASRIMTCWMIDCMNWERNQIWNSVAFMWYSPAISRNWNRFVRAVCTTKKTARCGKNGYTRFLNSAPIKCINRMNESIESNRMHRIESNRIESSSRRIVGKRRARQQGLHTHFTVLHTYYTHSDKDNKHKYYKYYVLHRSRDTIVGRGIRPIFLLSTTMSPCTHTEHTHPSPPSVLLVETDLLWLLLLLQYGKKVSFLLFYYYYRRERES